MQCKFCRQKVEVFLRMYNLRLCRDHFCWFFLKRISEAVSKFKMFPPGAKVVVAISGGKDSLSLTLALKELGYRVSGYFLDLGIPGSSELAKEKIMKFADTFSIEVRVESLKESFGYTLPEVAKVIKRPACAFCGTLKRYYMNRFAMEVGAEALCTGHTMLDEATVLFANTLQWKKDYLFRQWPVLPSESGFAKKTKPLVFVTERETSMYCFFKGIDYLESPCPFSQGATSRRFKRHLLGVEEEMPGTIIRFLKGFYSFKKILPIETVAGHEAQLQPCERCGYPTSAGGLCSVCRMKERVARFYSSPIIG